MKKLSEVKDEQAQSCHGKNWADLTIEEKGYMVDVVASAYAYEHVIDAGERTQRMIDGILKTETP